ncbi:hypothetical protein [Pseudonocardia sp. H11422]|uniref:hypothetical protein n=1 Tax=Pseudonocardia sp. H11422 TaxID=2835866 RepID=UPI002028086A|nr:hypothetical protein [Pseudonocardia sp. H11422]
MTLAQTAGPDMSGWYLGFGIGIVVVLVVVALVVPILVLAHKIGKQAPAISAALQQSERNTRPLADLRQTIDHAGVITAGLRRGRERLGG